MNYQRKYIVLIIPLLLLLITFTLFYPRTPSNDNNASLSLQSPSFISEAKAANSTIGTKLDDEAGISAYYKSPSSIDLAQVKGAFRTIELETSDYIIGSVAVPNYEENFDTHVYVNKDGWILAYYLKADPVSKIVDAKAYSIETTKLKTVVAAIASAAGAPFDDVTYYDFRYPNATNIMFVAEDDDNGNDFSILLPSSYGYFERGFSMFLSIGNYSEGFVVDGINMLDNATYCHDFTCYGLISASQLLPDVTHTISVYDGDTTWYKIYGVLVIIYRVP